MPLHARVSHRSCVVEEVSRFSQRQARLDLLDNRDVESGFQLMSAPAPPRDQTRFKVYRAGHRLMVAIALFDSSPGPAEGPRPDSVEIHFDPQHDRIGRVQFILNPDGSTGRDTYLPYPEQHASHAGTPELLRYELTDEPLPGRLHVRWVTAWIDVRQVARDGRGCGFNVFRYRPDIREYCAWQYPGGNGFQDPTDYGDLWLQPPAAMADELTVDVQGTRLALAATGLPADTPARLVDPLGETHELTWQQANGSARSEVTLAERVPGRYRVVLPDQQWHIDLPAEQPEPITMAVTADPPMNMQAGHYTPDRLDEEMAAWANVGVDRLYWIEVGDYPAFWERFPTHAKTERACGDLLAAMSTAAKRQGVEPWAVFKTYDMGFNCWFVKGKSAQQRDSVRDLEGLPLALAPELAAHQDQTMHAHPDWPTEPDGPVTTLRFYSRQPIASVRPKDVQLLISDDNRRYRPYRGRYKVEQSEQSRPHYRWTPAGKVRDRGRERNHVLELSGLKLTSPYVAVQVTGPEVRLAHRTFMLAEALNGEGVEQPLTLATAGDTEAGFRFWKEWPSWVNRNEPLLEHVQWSMRPLGMALRVMPNMPTLLEPVCEGARQIWLNRIERALEAGVAGVDVRTLCHHNGVLSYLRYAFGPAVLAAFEQRYGRAPELVSDDYERIRRLRGEAYTQMLREARALTQRYGAKLAVHLESGMEVPPHLDTRMQIHWDWQRWIEEGIVDEVTLKWFTAQSTFVHEQVLPLCRRHGVPVHICSRNLDQGFEQRGTELLPLLFRQARNAGFAGYNLYETANLSVMSPTGRFTFKGNIDAALRAATRPPAGG